MRWPHLSRRPSRLADVAVAIRRLSGAILALALVVALPGCESMKNKVLDTFQGKIELGCPPFAILADANRRLEFQPGPGRDLTDIDTEVTLDTLHVSCGSEINRKTRSGTLTVKVDPVLTAVRGPANTSRKTKFDYFVSVTNLADKILYRQAFSIDVAFDENETRRVINARSVTLTIPIQSGQTERNFRVLVGLVLTREQLDFNRKDSRPRL